MIEKSRQPELPHVGSGARPELRDKLLDVRDALAQILNERSQHRVARIRILDPLLGGPLGLQTFERVVGDIVVLPLAFEAKFGVKQVLVNDAQKEVVSLDLFD